MYGMSNRGSPAELTEKLTLELRRGVVVLAALSQLGESQYGYSLMQRLSEKGLAIDQGTLYPLLRRLEEQGLLDSQWQIEEGRPRRYYLANELGAEVTQRLAVEWWEMVAVVGKLLEKQSKDTGDG
jgi:DNA-binding PadR family transcriptional regulator